MPEVMEVLPLWTLETALPTVRLIQATVQPVGFHAALAGSVLTKGQSHKDLDVIVFPHVKDEQNIAAARDALVAIGFTMLRDKETVQEGWKYNELGDTKHVERWQDPDGRRVDLFFLS